MPKQIQFRLPSNVVGKGKVFYAISTRDMNIVKHGELNFPEHTEVFDLSSLDSVSPGDRLVLISSHKAQHNDNDSYITCFESVVVS